MTEEDVEEASEACTEFVSSYGDNTEFTQQQSIDIYRYVAGFCAQRADDVEREMNE